MVGVFRGLAVTSKMRLHISFAEEDRNQVRELEARVRAEGFETWFMKRTSRRPATGWRKSSGRCRGAMRSFRACRLGPSSVLGSMTTRSLWHSSRGSPSRPSSFLFGSMSVRCLSGAARPIWCQALFARGCARVAAGYCEPLQYESHSCGREWLVWGRERRSRRMRPGRYRGSGMSAAGGMNLRLIPRLRER